MFCYKNRKHSKSFLLSHCLQVSVYSLHLHNKTISSMCRHMGCFMSQAVLESQKTSVPGDLISIPGATEKISFILACLAFNLFFLGGCKIVALLCWATHHDYLIYLTVTTQKCPNIHKALETLATWNQDQVCNFNKLDCNFLSERWSV